ncbi:acylneuraminate cytidylyltransferase family protein [Candidatus Daviesbacteria bacterium]|nr:acylneuraminate cytidylyltransferase family protein [Candidatus Daviesbacteria bacterium]
MVRIKKNKNNSIPKVLGVVGARSGSKSIPYKNIYPLAGKPLMAWIIEAAKNAKFITRLILSTDSEEFAKIGRIYGAETPFLRPLELATDEADDISYLTHAVSYLEKNENWKPDIILRLPATSPFCSSESIDACIQILLDDPKASSARTIKKTPKHPFKQWKIEGDELKPFLPKEITGLKEPSQASRHSFPPAYAHVDVIAVRYNTLMKEGLLTGKRTRFVLLNSEAAIDIDDLNDFLLAEIIIKRKLS